MELRRALAELTEKHQRELDELRSKLVAATTALESLERRVLGPKSDAAAGERAAAHRE